jgi:hypothetical protein
MQGHFDAIHGHFLGGQPMQIKNGGAIEQRRHFEIADFHPVETRALIVMLGCSSPSGVGPGN